MGSRSESSHDQWFEWGCSHKAGDSVVESRLFRTDFDPDQSMKSEETWDWAMGSFAFKAVFVIHEENSLGAEEL